MTGIRHDPYADQHRILVEQDKPDDVRGFYIYPEGYSQSRGLSIPGQIPSMTKLAPQPSARPSTPDENLDE